MSLRRFAGVVTLLFAGLSMTALADAFDSAIAVRPPDALSALRTKARARLTATPRLDLAAPSADLFEGADSLESADSGHIPNYLRALAGRPGASKAFAHLLKTVLYGGSVEPEVKMGMGLRIAQAGSSPYVAAHLERLLRASAHGQAVLSTIESGHFESLRPADGAALNYADWLSPVGYSVSDSNFQRLRGQFNDSEIVELTLTVCFFNYFTRLAEGLNLPVESWVLDSPAHPPGTAYERSLSRVHVITDGELAMTGAENAAVKQMSTQSSLHIANTERAMLWSPEIAQAWWAYGKTARQSAVVTRDILLQVSFAVSMVNGCHY